MESRRTELTLKDFFLRPGSLVEQRLSARAALPWIALAFCGYAAVGLALPSRGLYAVPTIVALSTLLGVPTLYIFDAFAGSRLRVGQILTISLIALVIPGVMLLGYLLPLGFLGLTIGIGRAATATDSSSLTRVGVSIAVLACTLLTTREVRRLLNESAVDPPTTSVLKRAALHRAWMVVQLAIVGKMLAIHLWH
ncbi:MAG: hypothetical protein KC609_07390 [Myxococcales bacterium]|nr:hypothetical protein [Myxococcales bacterium]